MCSVDNDLSRAKQCSPCSPPGGQASKEVCVSSTNLTTALPIEQMTNSKDSQFAQYCLRAQMNFSLNLTNKTKWFTKQQLQLLHDIIYRGHAATLADV